MTSLTDFWCITADPDVLFRKLVTSHNHCWFDWMPYFHGNSIVNIAGFQNIIWYVLVYSENVHYCNNIIALHDVTMLLPWCHVLIWYDHQDSISFVCRNHKMYLYTLYMYGSGIVTILIHSYLVGVGWYDLVITGEIVFTQAWLYLYVCVPAATTDRGQLLSSLSCVLPPPICLSRQCLSHLPPLNRAYTKSEHWPFASIH